MSLQTTKLCIMLRYQCLAVLNFHITRKKLLITCHEALKQGHFSSGKFLLIVGLIKFTPEITLLKPCLQ